MAKILKVLTYPHPILSLKAKPILSINQDIKNLANNMLLTMKKHDGIGLAANQIAELLQIAVIDIDNIEEKHIKELMPLVLINPQVIESSKEKLEYEEGCLSFPGLRVLTKRPSKVKVKYTNLEGNEQVIQAENLLSICLQHEIDHLNGILFINKVSALKKEMLLNKYKKLQKVEQE